MAPKKKKGKTSKFARMTDEERARYLQHRIELELEVKRRKQQLIAAYSKLKLNREEIFSRLNNAKINEQWRSLLRKIKSQELYERAQYLRQIFDKTVAEKDAVIRQLYQRLELSDLDHGRLQKAHMIAIDNLIEQNKQRIDFLKNHYKQEVEDRKIVDVEEIKSMTEQMNKSNNYIKTVVLLQERNTDKLLSDTRIENTIKTLTLKLSCEEEMSVLTLEIGSKIKDIWLQLEEIIQTYEINTESKKKKYEYLKGLDDACRIEIAEFPKLQCQLQDTLEALKNEQESLNEDRKSVNMNLKNQIFLLNNRINELRQEIKRFQAVDATQLKYLIINSNKSINKLKEILEKGSTLKMLMNLCIELELTINVKKFSNEDKNSYTKVTKDSINNSFDTMFKFWDHLNYMKAENMLKIKERDKLIAENIRIQQLLKSYFANVSSVPSIR